mmetsp:Transcript_17689/g.48098  ORF Transcript_17689/g.48098 Transcript_17689/m.48098 type:complete len:556 (-) Transcript_17689:91-1758(-)|eukprot:CAMPEP_0171187604 /NCGR_PEP_ID=MMETSP0790-20130122/17406_1 /TAXON_ID=2925 /ORGANISM="Alexandrium catenella, Strain OF101" /LENGTH=555 /DNA_ID=CAMNT_0011652669 /DNA_START=45 /DNA_END=1712 /DNA_ORIENTATION=+
MAGNGENTNEEQEVKENEELQVAEYEDAIVPVAANSLGIFDGYKFYLRSFAVWYRWRPWQYQRAHDIFTDDKPESGTVNGVHFEQSMGRMVLWYELRDKYEGLTEDDLSVDMSCWEVRVNLGREGKPTKRVGKKIDGISGETYKDIRRKQSWWQIVEDGEWPGRWLMVSLAKLEHRPWRTVWYDSCLNAHKKQIFSWTPHQVNFQIAKLLKSDEEGMDEVPPGEPQEPEKIMTTGILPERLCTGMDDDDETPEQIHILIHFDEATLEVASGMVPLEELFAADVEVDRIDVYLRHDGLGLCSGQFVGRVIPELTAWELVSVRRKLPKDTAIKAPAFYNQALRITLVKAPGHRVPWGHAFADAEMPQHDAPRERESWTDRVQRALVLSPCAPMSAVSKVERARKICTKIECSQDSVTNKAFIILHLEEKMGEMFWRYKVDPTGFFSLKVGTDVIQINVVADAEFTMCAGRLGGKCIPDKTSYEITQERNSPDEEREHIALRVGLTKAADSKGAWKEVFTRLEEWQLNEDLHQSLVDNPPAEPKAESQGEPAKQAATA